MDDAARVLCTDVTGGLIALVAVLAAASVLGLTLRRRAGRFRGAPGRPAGQAGPVNGTTPLRAGAPDAGTGPGAGAGPGDGTGPGAGTVPGAGAGPGASAGPDVLTEADLGGPLGRRATLVQFSTAFCAPCRPTRQILSQVAGMVAGVAHVEVDAAARLDLVRRLRVNSTPTVLVLDQDGAIVKRAAGLPRKADVIAALGSVIEPEAPGVTAPAGGE
jgi:thiol-disulfide isomerase/thioredoxin